MDFKAAINDHQSMKLLMKALIDGRPTVTADASVICRDDLCELGKWINNDGFKTIGTRATYTALKEHHTKFHAMSGAMVRDIAEGKRENAVKSLGGDYQLELIHLIQGIARCEEITK
jgi:hypothetical protein